DDFTGTRRLFITRGFPIYLLLETLENRLLPSGSGLPAIAVDPTIYPLAPIQTEVEPNDTLEEANPIQLLAGGCREVCILGAGSANAGLAAAGVGPGAGALLYPPPWPGGQESGIISGQLGGDQAGGD